VGKRGDWQAAEGRQNKICLAVNRRSAAEKYRLIFNMRRRPFRDLEFVALIRREIAG
jgi:hypothetical protein